eukprot:9245646-Pyramimonas_sp.AAC.1
MTSTWRSSPTRRCSRSWRRRERRAQTTRRSLWTCSRSSVSGRRSSGAGDALHCCRAPLVSGIPLSSAGVPVPPLRGGPKVASGDPFFIETFN